jgi:hypothetical protein
MIRLLTIDEQVEVIKKVTAEAAKSKESALKFLRDAGIIPPEDESAKRVKKKKAIEVNPSPHIEYNWCP